MGDTKVTEGGGTPPHGPVLSSLASSQFLGLRAVFLLFSPGGTGRWGGGGRRDTEGGSGGSNGWPRPGRLAWNTWCRRRRLPEWSQTTSVHPGSAAPAGTPGLILHSYSFSSCAPPWRSLKSRAVEPKEHSEGHGTLRGKKHRGPVSNQGGSEAGPDAACDLCACEGQPLALGASGLSCIARGGGGGTAPTSQGDARIPWSAVRGAGWGLTAPTSAARTWFIVMDGCRSEGPRQTHLPNESDL